MEIIGIGNAGKNICSMFEDKGYKAYTIDSSAGSSIVFPKVKTMEEAEAVELDLSKIKNSIVSEEILFVLSGAGIISGACLKILEEFKDKQINIIYIEPDSSFLTNQNKIREKVVRNVLQEFTRSGLFNKIWIVSNKNISNLSTDISIGNYFEKINEKIVDIWHLMQYYIGTNPIMGNIEEPKEINRIATFGIYDLDNDIEKKFYDMSEIREKHFYFTFSEDTLAETGRVLQIVSSKLNKVRENEFQEISHAFFNSGYTVDKVYVLYYTNHIQGETNRLFVS